MKKYVDFVDEKNFISEEPVMYEEYATRRGKWWSAELHTQCLRELFRCGFDQVNC